VNTIATDVNALDCVSILSLPFTTLNFCLFHDFCKRSIEVSSENTILERELLIQLPTPTNTVKPIENITTTPEEILVGTAILKGSRSETPNEFLKAYDWTVRSELGEYEITLPTSFVHEPGIFPTTLYWAFTNELSRALGLDFSSHLGETVLVTVYSLEESLPTFLFPYTEGRAVILRQGDEIIGAWIDVGMYLDASSSLDRRSFREIIDPRNDGMYSLQFHRLFDYWGDWLVNEKVVLLENDNEVELASLTPEQLIQNFFSAINAQNYVEAYACYTRDELSYTLFVNMLSSGEDGKIFHENYQDAVEHGYNFVENIASVEVIEIKVLNPREILYAVTFNVKYKEEDIFHNNGNTRRFFILKEEIEGFGYRIDSIGTGP